MPTVSELAIVVKAQAEQALAGLKSVQGALGDVQKSVKRTASATKATRLEFPDMKIPAMGTDKLLEFQKEIASASDSMKGGFGAMVDQVDMFQQRIEGAGEQMALFPNAVLHATNVAEGGLDTLAKTPTLARFGAAVKETAASVVSNLRTVIPVASSVAGAIGGAFLGITKQIAAGTEEIVHVSMETGIAAQTLERWQPILQRTGLGVGQFAQAYKALSKDILAAQSGNEAAIQKFEAMGLAIEDLGDTEAVINAVADRIAALTNPAERAQLAVDLLGKGALKLIPALAGGSEGLRAGADMAERFGQTLDDVQRGRLLAFDDALDDMNSNWLGLKTQIALLALPALETLGTGIRGALEWFNSLSQGTKDVALAFGTVCGRGRPRRVRRRGAPPARLRRLRAGDRARGRGCRGRRRRGRGPHCDRRGRGRRAHRGDRADRQALGGHQG